MIDAETHPDVQMLILWTRANFSMSWDWLTDFLFHISACIQTFFSWTRKKTSVAHPLQSLSLAMENALFTSVFIHITAWTLSKKKKKNVANENNRCGLMWREWLNYKIRPNFQHAFRPQVSHFAPSLQQRPSLMLIKVA